MAKTGYGRTGVAVGGKGGTSLHQAYAFGPQAAESYLKGGLAGEYKVAQETLRKDVPTISGGPDAAGKQSLGITSLLKEKKKATKDIGRLREIAGASAVGSFFDYANTLGRATRAHAPKGLLTGETFGAVGGSGEEQAGRGGLGHMQNIRQGLGMRGASKEETISAIDKITGGREFKPGGALSYSKALSGADPRSSLYGKFQALRGGQTTVQEAFGYDTPMKRVKGRRYGRFGRGQSYDAPIQTGPTLVANPEEILFGGERSYLASQGDYRYGR